MTTAPVTSTPPTDPWSDARLAARGELGEDVLGPARRRQRYRSAVVGVAQVAFVLAVLTASWALEDPTRDEVSLLGAPPWAGIAIFCLGFGIQMVGSVRRSGALNNLSSTPADALLAAEDRRWVRIQIASGTPVAAERREVVVDRARRLAASGHQVYGMLGFVLIMLGLVVTSPSASFTGAAVLLTAYAIASATRDVVRARRARRWLALHAEPTA